MDEYKRQRLRLIAEQDQLKTSMLRNLDPVMETPQDRLAFNDELQSCIDLLEKAGRVVGAAVLYLGYTVVADRLNEKLFSEEEEE